MASLLDKVVSAMYELGCSDRRAALVEIARQADRDGGFFHIAQTYGALVNNSGEEFAIQFMTAYNKEVSPRY